MATIYEVSLQYKRDLLRHERKATERILAAYGIAWEAIDRELQKLLTEFLAASAGGQRIPRSWLLRRDRLETLRDQAARAIAQFASSTASVTQRAQGMAVEQAVQHAKGLVATGMTGSPTASIGVAWNRLPEEALERLVGQLSDGSPLRSAIRTTFAGEAEAIASQLIEGLALGRNPRETARRMAGLVEDRTKQTRTKALTVARTETNRAYRSAAIENYQANDVVVQQWQWSAALDERTCPVCWAMHGTIHELSEEFGSHPNCRCSPVPVIVPMYAVSSRRMETGEERFAALPADKQEAILGPLKFAAYQAGEIRLSDLVGTRQDERWGLIRGEVSLDLALVRARKRAA